MHGSKIHSLIALALIFVFACNNKNKTNWELISPDGNIKLSVFQESANSQIFYNVLLKSDDKFITVIDTSPLGITRNDENFTNNLIYKKQATQFIDEEYKMLTGKQSTIHTTANELVLSFVNNNNAAIDIILRAYEDGVAFRYFFPEDADKKTVINESTGFKIPLSGKAWIAPYDTVSYYAPAYETYYEVAIPVGTTSPNRNGWGFPALFEVNNSWILISEADLNETYCGMHLQPEAKDGLYTLRFPEKDEAEKHGEAFPSSELPWETPWRVAIIGDNPGDILESNMVHNLSDASVLTETDWIGPGKSSWSWWSNNPSPKDFNKLLPFVDLSADLNWEYTLVDSGWDSMQNGEIKSFVEYSISKGVDVFMWYNSSGPHTVFKAYPRDLMHIDKVRQAEMAKISSWGVKGIKVDFFQSDKQNIIKLYHDIMRDAAENKLLVNFHGCTLPRGWSRTFPNLLTMEAVKGEEVYRFGQQYPKKAPVQNSILAFTRNVVGPMDYTPLGFSNRKFPHLTTFSHEVALSVVFESGIIHFADDKKEFERLPKYVKEFLKEVPSAWDETKYVAGYPGEMVVIARCKGDKWYLGGINSKSTTETIEFSFSFLLDGEYKLDLIIDGDSMKEIDKKTQTCNNKSTISVKMLPYGGFSAILTNTSSSS